MSGKIEPPKVFTRGLSTVRFLWCKRNEMFALNSLEVLDYSKFIYRCLKSSGYKAIVFLNYVPDSSRNKYQYRYTTYDRASYCIFNYLNIYEECEKEGGDYNQIMDRFIERMPEELEKEKKKKSDGLINRQTTVQEKMLPPVRGRLDHITVDVSHESLDLINKITPFFSRGLDKLNFAFVLPAFLFQHNSIVSELSTLLDFLSRTHNLERKTILITVEDEKEYEEYCKAISRAIDIHVNDIYAEAKKREGERLTKVNGAENDEIRNLLLRFRLLEPRKFNYTPLEADLLADKVKLYAENEARVIGCSGFLINALTYRFKNNRDDLSNKIQEILSSLRKDLMVAKSKKIINEEKAALSINRLIPPSRENIPDFDELAKELLEMPGLDDIKRRLGRMYKAAQFDKTPTKPSHFIFMGRPGTGKTEVARLMGKMFYALGILSTSNVVEVSKPDLTGSFQGDNSTKPLQKCQEALGGVLLVDEAYQLVKGNSVSGDSDIVTTIMKFIEDHRESMCTIFTGYGREMKEFLRNNPGMTSRVGKKNIIEFPDYSVDELMQIAGKMAYKKGLVFHDSFSGILRKLFEYRLKHADENYGNARDVREIIDGAQENLKSRLFDIQNTGSTVSEKDRITLIAEDLDDEYRRDITILDGEKLSFEEITKELNEMVGLNNIKQRLERVYKSLEIRKQQGKAPPKPSHFIFKGRPGTGKTEVARQLGKIYHSFGVLPTSKVIEVSKSDLTGMWQGDTSTKPLQKCQEALGGVLLVDEAYQLVEGNPLSGDSDIVTTIMKFIEDHRESMCAIFTGYGPEMDKFVSTNSGMLSRLGEQNEIEFPDYSVDELVQIADKMASKTGYKMGDSFTTEIRALFKHRLENAGDSYGNARDVRQIIDYACESLEVRIYDTQKNNLAISEDDSITLVAEDLDGYGKH